MRKERKRKMKKEIKKFLVMILTAMLVIGVFPGGGASKVKAENNDVSSAQSLELSDSDDSVSVEFKQTRVDGYMTRSYYKLIVKLNICIFIKKIQ